MTPDSMTVRLHLHRICVVEVVTDLPERLEVLVRYPYCGLRTTKVHETRRVRVKDVPRGVQKVTLLWLRRRFACENCGERHTESHRQSPASSPSVWAPPSSPTAATCRSPRSPAATGSAGTQPWPSCAPTRRASPSAGGRAGAGSCCDETSLRRRHRYVTVLFDAESGEVLGIIRHREFRALARVSGLPGAAVVRPGRRRGHRRVAVLPGRRDHRSSSARRLRRRHHDPQGLPAEDPLRVPAGPRTPAHQLSAR